MNKINWIFSLTLAIGPTASAFSIAQAQFADSLHYRFSSDNAIWDEELGAYTITLDFELKWDVTGTFPESALTTSGFSVPVVT